MNFPVLIGASRKRFIGSVINESDPNKRIFGTALQWHLDVLLLELIF